MHKDSPQRIVRLAAAAWLVSLLSTAAHADLVALDFNDINPAQLVGQSGGQGTTGNWLGSTHLHVVAGNLTSTNYFITPSGPPQSVRALSDGGGGNSVARQAIANPLTGEVWFSFLAQLTDNNDRVALSINPTDAAIDNDDGDFIFVGAGTGNQGQFRTRLGTDSVTGANNLSQNGTTAYLVVGRIHINGDGANDVVDVWLNPNALQLAAGNLTPTFTDSAADWITGSQISAIGVSSYGGANGGVIDAVRLSDTAAAFTDVTGVSNTNIAFDFGLTGHVLQAPVDGVPFTRLDVAASNTASVTRSVLFPDVQVTLAALPGGQLQGRSRNNMTDLTSLDNLLDDFVFNTAGDGMTLTFDGLAAGWYEFTGYFNDSFNSVALWGNALDILDADNQLLDSVVVSNVRNGNPGTLADVGIGQFSFYTDGAAPVSFTLLGVGDDTRFAFNGFELTAVPEPSAWASLALGGLGALLVVRRRRKEKR